MSSENPNASSAGTQANLSIGGGPHMRTRVSAPGGGMCFSTICQAQGIESSTERLLLAVVATSGLRVLTPQLVGYMILLYSRTGENTEGGGSLLYTSRMLLQIHIYSGLLKATLLAQHVLTPLPSIATPQQPGKRS